MDEREARLSFPTLCQIILLLSGFSNPCSTISHTAKCCFHVKTPSSHKVLLTQQNLEWARVPHWLGNRLMICLYGLGRFFPLELAFVLARSKCHNFTWYQNPLHPCLGSLSTLQLGLGMKRMLEWARGPHWLGNIVDLVSPLLASFWD